MKVKAGWLYKGPRKKNPDDRIGGEFGRGHFVPVMDKDGILCLVDSAVLRNHGKRPEQSKTDAAIERCIELGESEHQWTISSIIGDYYQGDDYIYRPDSDGELPDVFEPLCDLRDMRGVKGGAEDERWFDEDDKVRNVHLYREHGYSWSYGDIGVTIVKKDAEPMLAKKLDAALYDYTTSCTSPYSSSYRLGEVEDAVDAMESADIELTPLLQMKLRAARERDALLHEWEKELNERSTVWVRDETLARMLESGDAFSYESNEEATWPEWFAELVGNGTFEDDGDGEYLWPNELSSDWYLDDTDGVRGGDVWGNTGSPAQGRIVYRREECIDRVNDEWGYRYGSCEAPWS